jgi:anhydro-N-acetylmuramic acid kinase
MYIGLMSGTSLDAIDAVLVEIEDASCIVRQTCSTEYPAELAARLRAMATTPAVVDLAAVGALNVRTAAAFAAAARKVMNAAEVKSTAITAIGSHGQTVLHRPEGDHPFSMQLGDPGTLAALTGVTVVADFRSADIALGGEGAPLVPAFHRWAFSHPTDVRAVVNIGGIANVTRLDPRGDTTGYDTGPGNTLLDHWCRDYHGTAYDVDGAWAAGGAVDPALLALMQADPYFAHTPPKSTGTDYFNLAWVRHQLETLDRNPDPRDIQATLSELTARTIAAGIEDARTAAICGGGIFNADLMQRIDRLLHPRRTVSTAAWGIAPEWVEAVAFAWLARQRLRDAPTSIPTVTGAREAVSLGGIYLPPGR